MCLDQRVTLVGIGYTEFAEASRTKGTGSTSARSLKHLMHSVARLDQVPTRPFARFNAR
jgi:hypothetical protein